MIVSFNKHPKAGDIVAHGVHRDVGYQVVVGNDVMGKSLIGRLKFFRTLITQSTVGGQTQYACHVIATRILPSRITYRRIVEAVDSWKEALDDLLDKK